MSVSHSWTIARMFAERTSRRRALRRLGGGGLVVAALSSVSHVPPQVTATQSTGTSIWTPVDLEPGTYGLVCLFPDLADGMPHAYMGMYTIVEVSA